MPYRFALDRPDYADLASGRVLHSAPGFPAFPVRLASEIFQRCLALRADAGLREPCVLYDLCCGTGYLLTVLAYLHGTSLSAVIGSDIDEKACELARRNLALLSRAGLDARAAELAALNQRYGKEAHREALASAQRLQARLEARGSLAPTRTAVFQADALDGVRLREQLGGEPMNIVLVDVPYGLHSQWRLGEHAGSAGEPLWALLEVLQSVVGATSVVAIVSDKGQKAAAAGYKRLEQFQLGKRRIAIYQPLGDGRLKPNP